jgi:predicted O-linked N-acetylglucosamine transferase (SPINDLY family)
MTWQSIAYPFLLEKNYQRVAEIYEELIENAPDTVSHYWYLGVAYLLQNLQAEAQVMWQYVFSQGEPEAVKQWNRELEEVIDTEAKRQQNLGNFAAVDLLRYHLWEIIPNSINNLLAWANLLLDIEQFDPDNLLNYDFFQPLNNHPDRELLLTVVLKMLAYPSDLTLEFARQSLPYLQEYTDRFIPDAFSVANRVAIEQYSPAFSAEILRLCLQIRANDIALLEQLVNFNILAENLQNSLEAAYQFRALCPTPSLQLYSHYKIVAILLQWGVWQEIDKIYPHYQRQLQESIDTGTISLEPLIQTSFLNLSTPLPYLDDLAQENRQITNRISEIFYQNSIQNERSRKIAKRSGKLRIGYIAHTLRGHSVGWLCRWLIHYHDREKFHLFLYTINQPEDEITRKWFRDDRDTIRHYPHQQDAAKIAARIRDDHLDILVDLDSLTHNLTCQVLAQKPAPIQVTWLGWDASGLPTIDYYIADPYVLPDNAEEYYREKIYRLPETYLAIDGFEIGEPTLTRKDLNIPEDSIIYLSVQSGLKRHPRTIALQMKILQAVPDSYFLIKGVGNAEKLRALFADIALSEGVDPERLRFLPRDRDEPTHRANLAIADVVLDTYPYNGATTTLEVLWRGIPLVTRVGQQFAARNSYTFLRNAGIEAGIAFTDAEYIEWGIRLGSDRSLRQAIAEQLLANRTTSPLWQGEQFARQMEIAYQTLRG